MNVSRPATADNPLALISAAPDKAAAETHVQRGDFVIGKLNLLLIGLIGVILFALISREESLPTLQHAAGHATASGPEMANPIAVHSAAQALDDPTRHQTTTDPAVSDQNTSPATDADATASATAGNRESTAAQVTTRPSAAEGSPADQRTSASTATASTARAGGGKSPSKRRKAKANARSPAPAAALSSASNGSADSLHGQQMPPEESAEHKEAVRKMLVFNIWSVSELRLRTAFASYLNDGAIAAQQLETRKRDYLDFVSQRSKKCGDLDNKFLSNINTYEKLSIHKHEIDVLQCHATENNIELDKLNL